MNKMTLFKLKEKYSSWLSSYNANVYIYIDLNREFGNLDEKQIDFFLKIEDEILNELFRTINNTFNILKYIEIRNKNLTKKENLNQIFNDLQNTYLQIKELSKYIVGESKINSKELLKNYQKLIADLNIITLNKDTHINLNEPNRFYFNPIKSYKIPFFKREVKLIEYWENEDITDMNDYAGISHSIKGNHLLSHNDVFRLTIHNSIELLKDYAKPDIVQFLLNNIFNNYNSTILKRKINFNSLYKNTNKLRFYSIQVYQPIRYKDIHPMFCPHIRLKIEPKYPNSKQYIHENFSPTQQNFPKIIP